MLETFIGSEAVAGGALSRARMRWNYRALFPDVYVPKHSTPSLKTTTVAAWLWSGRQSIIAGRAAAALHGALWVDDSTPIELISTASRSPAGIIVRNERIDADEITEVAGMLVTTPARTALDLARHLPRAKAVGHVDALLRATRIPIVDIERLSERHPRARGLPRARQTIALADGGAQSPRETWLRLLLIDAGLPRPHTQIRVSEGFSEAFLDMGYPEPMVGIDYDGSIHSSDRARYVHDIGRAEMIERRGWLHIRVVAEHTRAFILHRVRQAFIRRGWGSRCCA